jgi:signal transduction histidine kinase
MSIAALPDDEAERLAALHALNILDTPPEPLFDAAVENVLRVCKTPYAQVAFVDRDRLWAKAGLGGVGAAGQQHSRDLSACAHTILQDGVQIVEDTLADTRSADSPFVCNPPHVRFYAGVPLLAGAQRKKVGCLSVYDTLPRQLSVHQIDYLQTTASILSAALVSGPQPQLLAGLLEACRFSVVLVSAKVGHPVLMANAQFRQVYGFAQAAATGRPLAEFLRLDQPQPGCAIFNHALATGKPCQVRLRCLQGDGQSVSSTVLAYPLPGLDGSAAYFAVLLLPSLILGYEKFFLALGERDREFMLSLHVDGFWALDAKLRISELSDFPSKPGDGDIAPPRIGQKIWHSVASADLPKANWKQLEADLMARRAVRDFQFCRSSNLGERWLSLSGYPVYAEGQRFTGYRGTVRNITEEVQAKLVQQQQQSLLKACLDNMQPGVIVLRNEVVVYANTSANDMLGDGAGLAQALLGVPVAQLVAPQDLEFARQRLTQIGTDGVSVPPTWLKLRNLGGDLLQATISLSAIVWNGQPHLLATLTRLSEGSMLEVDIRATQERYERLLVAESETHQTHIARELHDSLGSHLAGISMMLADIKVRHPRDAELSADLTRTLGYVQTASEVTRGLARGLMPVDDTPGSFWRALERLCLDTQHIKGLDCEFDMDGNFDETPPLTANHLYRMAQEAITNALRHGQASVIRVLLQEKADYCLMTVDDNGQGFDQQHQQHDLNPGMGLRSMRARSKMIHGYMGFSVGGLGGCCLSVYWPKHAADESPVTIVGPLM